MPLSRIELLKQRHLIQKKLEVYATMSNITPPVRARIASMEADLAKIDEQLINANPGGRLSKGMEGTKRTSKDAGSSPSAQPPPIPSKNFDQPPPIPQPQSKPNLNKQRVVIESDDTEEEDHPVPESLTIPVKTSTNSTPRRRKTIVTTNEKIIPSQPPIVNTNSDDSDDTTTRKSYAPININTTPADPYSIEQSTPSPSTIESRASIMNKRKSISRKSIGLQQQVKQRIIIEDSDDYEVDEVDVTLQQAKLPQTVLKSTVTVKPLVKPPTERLVIESSDDNDPEIPPNTKIEQISQKSLLNMNSDEEAEYNRLFLEKQQNSLTKNNKNLAKTVVSSEFDDLLNSTDAAADQAFNDPWRAQPPQRISAYSSDDEDDNTEIIKNSSNAADKVKLAKMLLDTKDQPQSSFNTPSKRAKLLTSSATTSHSSNDEHQARTNVPAFLDFDRLLTSMYTDSEYSMFSNNHNKQQIQKPNLIYIQILFQLMTDIRTLESTYDIEAGSKGNKGGVAVISPNQLQNNNNILFNHIVPSFIQLPPLPHQVYSFFWLIAHERDHDYCLYKYNLVLTPFFKNFLTNAALNIKSNQSLSAETKTELLTDSHNFLNPSLITKPSDFPLLYDIHSNPYLPSHLQNQPHTPLLHGAMLCDDCGLGKTYQLIALSTSDIGRLGVTRAFEWIRATLYHIQKKYINVNKTSNSNQYKQVAFAQYDNDPYVLRLTMMLFEIGLILTEHCSSFIKSRGVGFQLPLLSPCTQIFIYIASVYPYLCRAYVLRGKGDKNNIKYQFDLVNNFLYYIGVDRSLLSLVDVNLPAIITSTTEKPQSYETLTAKRSTGRFVIESDSDDDVLPSRNIVQKTSGTSPPQQDLNFIPQIYPDLPTSFNQEQMSTYTLQTITSNSGSTQSPHLRMKTECPLCHQHSEHAVGGLYGATLVVCVKSVMTQWEQEVCRAAGTHQLPINTISSLLLPQTLDMVQTSSNSSQGPIPLQNTFVYHSTSRLQLFDSAWEYEQQCESLRENLQKRLKTSESGKKGSKKGETSLLEANSFCLCTCLPRYNFVLTTYETLRNDYNRYIQREAERENGVKKSTNKKGKNFVASDTESDEDDEVIELNDLTLHDVIWGRLIFDESHKVKNSTTQNYKAAFELTTCNDIFYDKCIDHDDALVHLSQMKQKSLSSQQNTLNREKAELYESMLFDHTMSLTTRPGGRFCVSATPLHNSVSDLFSMIKLLRFRPYNKKSIWTQLLEQDKQITKITQQLQQIKNQQNSKNCIADDGENDDDSIDELSTNKKSKLWAIIQSCMIRRERTDKNDPKYTKLINFLKYRKTAEQVQKESKTKVQNPEILKQYTRNSNNEDNNDDIDDLINVFSTLNVDGEANSVALQTHSVAHQIPSKSEWNVPFKPSLLLHIPTGPQTPDAPLFLKHFIQQSPVETMLYDTVRTFTKIRLDNGDDIGLDGAEDGDLRSLKTDIFSETYIKDKQQKNKGNSIPIAVGPGVKKSSGGKMNYTSALQVFQLLTQCCNSVFLMSPNHIPLSFVLLRDNIRQYCTELGGVDHPDVISYNEQYGKDMIMKINRNDLNNDKRLLFDIQQKYSHISPIDDPKPTSTDEYYDPRCNQYIDKPITSSKKITKKGTIYLDSDESDNEDQLVNAFSKMSIDPPGGADNSMENKNTLLLYKQQRHRPITFLQFVDIYRRLLYNSQVQKPTATAFLSKLQSRVPYIHPKYAPKNFAAQSPLPLPTYGYSSKLSYLMYLLTYISITQPGVSVLVFSQYTRTLDVIERALKQHSGYYYSYLHHFIKNTTKFCDDCGKQSTLYPQKTCPLGNSQENEEENDNNTIDLTYLDQFSAQKVFHSIGLPSHISYTDIDLDPASIETNKCNCFTCQNNRKLKKYRENDNIIINPPDDIDENDDDAELVELRPYEELYYESQGYSSPGFINSCQSCCTTITTEFHKNKNVKFNGFASVTRIDGKQSKEQQEQMKVTFKQNVPKKYVDNTQNTLQSYELSHTCQCSTVKTDQINNSLVHNFPLPINIMLISLKAGGVGLNLVNASHVIMFEANWNPMDRFQAMCRCIRNFQTKTVFVHELCTINTIEERVFNVRQQKRLLSKQLVESGSVGQDKAVAMSLAEIAKILE